MFCPRCGGIKREMLVGGWCTGGGCVYCGKTLNCFEPLTYNTIQDSVPTRNPFKALWLRFMYNCKPGNRAKGKDNIRANEDFHKKNADDARAMRTRAKELRNTEVKFYATERK